MDRLDPAAGAFTSANESAAANESGTDNQPFSLGEWVTADRPADAVVRLRCDENVEDVEEHLDTLLALSRLVVEFPAFTDGRGFSVARQLRARGFAGELLAAGDVLPDQWQFLERCGFTGLFDDTVARRADRLPRIRAAYQST